MVRNEESHLTLTKNGNDNLQTNKASDLKQLMSQITNDSTYDNDHGRVGRKPKSKSEGDATSYPLFVISQSPSPVAQLIKQDEHHLHMKNKSSPVEEDLSSGVHSKSASPDSAAEADPHFSDEDTDAYSYVEGDNEVFHSGSTQPESDKPNTDSPYHLHGGDNFEIIEPSGQSQLTPTSPNNSIKPDVVMGIHRLYMSQFSTSTNNSGSGIDNLAFIFEEPEDDLGKANKNSNVENICMGESSSTKLEESFLENAHRTCIRDLRRMVQTAILGQKGIPAATFIDVFSRKDLLRKLFDLFDYKQQKELNQDEWIEYLKSRLDREERQVDFVEVVESVAYAVCGEDNVQFDQFCMIFRTKNVLNKFFRLIDRDFDGIVTAEEIMEFISALSTARTNNRLTKESIQWLEQLFRQYVGPNNEITKEDFKKIIQTKNQFFTDRVFDIFDNDASGSISLQEFIAAMHQFAGKEPDDKLRFLFKIYDVDGDGSIQCEELGKVMRACMEENGMKFSDDQIHELTMALFEDADVERRGALTFDALKAQLQKHEGLLENLSISIERWLVPPKPKESDHSRLQNSLKKLKPRQMSFKYFKNNYVYVCWLGLFIVTNISLFVSRCIVFHQDDPNASTFLMLARGAGQCLNFNCTFIVIWMLRGLLTFLRSRGASTFLPIDQHIYFHKMSGWLIFLFGLFHAVMHLINIDASLLPSPVVNSQNWTYLEFLFFPEPTSQKGVLVLGLIPGYAFNTGVALVVILTIMVICSLPFVRRGGCFEVFYWTHLLYSAFWIILIIHAPNFWKWFIVTGIIFIVEKVVRYYNWRMGRGRTSVSSGILLPSKVTHLVIRRPPNFEFHPGDYVFVRIPRIAKYEWHPFTISSAPEQSDAIWLHIRAVGEWTTRVFEFFENEQQKMNANNGIEEYGRDRLNTFVSNATVQSADVYNQAFGDNATNNVELIRVSDRRGRLPTVGIPDSQETIDPTSESSITPLDKSAQELSSSVDTVSEQDAIIKSKKVPIRLKPRPQLTSTKSLPNVHERLVKREVKLNLRNSPKNFHRSLSVNEAEENLGHGSGRGGRKPSSVSSPIGLSQRYNRVPTSLRYMRNKPRIISLKVPSYEYDGTTPTLDQNFRDNDRLAEEGRVGVTGDGSDVFDGEANELHPIMGTTRTGQGSLAVGRPLEIYLDGPYGAPSSHIFSAQHAVLIATGIGVTPFASILQSIMHRYWTTRVCCPRCRFTWCAELPQSVINLKKVDFFWINRDQRSFEWFVHLLSQLEIEQAELGGAMERFLDMHMYITSALQKTDMKAVGLQLALDLLHDREKRDLITGLKTKTHAGRPNWEKVFQQLQDQKKGKVTVFYCGPPALARTLKIKCETFGFGFRKELF